MSLLYYTKNSSFLSSMLNICQVYADLWYFKVFSSQISGYWAEEVCIQDRITD